MNQSGSCLKETDFDKNTSTIFSPDEIKACKHLKIPRHIAFIPDGNRRWAKKIEKEANHGHRHGADILIDTVKAAKEIGVKVVTFFTFSTENWMRPQDEVDGFMWLLQNYLTENLNTMIKEGIRLKAIGNLNKIPETVRQTVIETENATKEASSVTMVLAINYGGRDEIVRACKKMIKDSENKKLNTCDIDEQMFSSYLDTAPYGDPDLFIRTSGEMRISNFLIWQLSYAELYVADVLWPDFTPKHFLQAIIAYNSRHRRQGQ